MFYLVVTGNKDMQGNKLNLLYEECRLIFSCFSAERSPRKTHLEAVLPFAIRLILIRTELRPFLSISLLGRGQNKFFCDGFRFPSADVLWLNLPWFYLHFFIIIGFVLNIYLIWFSWKAQEKLWSSFYSRKHYNKFIFTCA